MATKNPVNGCTSDLGLPDRAKAPAIVFKGRRFDAGDKLSYLKAVIALASERVEFGEDLKTWMKAFVD